MAQISCDMGHLFSHGLCYLSHSPLDSESVSLTASLSCTPTHVSSPTGVTVLLSELPLDFVTTSCWYDRHLTWSWSPITMSKYQPLMIWEISRWATIHLKMPSESRFCPMPVPLMCLPWLTPLFTYILLICNLYLLDLCTLLVCFYQVLGV